MLREYMADSVLPAAGIATKTATENNNTDIARYKTIIAGSKNPQLLDTELSGGCFQIDTNSELYYNWQVSNEFGFFLHEIRRFL